MTNSENPTLYEFDMVVVELKNENNQNAEYFLCNVNESGDWENDAISDKTRYNIEFIASFLRGQFQNILLDSDDAARTTVRFSVLLKSIPSPLDLMVGFHSVQPNLRKKHHCGHGTTNLMMLQVLR